MRVLLTAFLVLLFLPGLGSMAFVPDRCPSPCEDDDDDGRCTPMCADCTCCVPAGPAVEAHTFVLSPALRMNDFPADPAIGTPASALRDILHIPKNLQPA